MSSVLKYYELYNKNISKTFLNNCITIINDSIKNNQTSSAITYKDMPQGLTYDDLNKVYDMLKGLYFNKGYGVSFEGFNDGSSVPIHNLNKPFEPFFEGDKIKLKEKTELLYKSAVDYIERNNLEKFSTDIIYPITGYMVTYVIKHASDKLSENNNYKIEYDFEKKDYILTEKQ